MAFTQTLVKVISYGNLRGAIYNMTADANSGLVACNVGIVDALSIAPISMSSAGIKFKINTNAASAASNGNILVSGCTSGDNFFITVYGHG